MTRDPARSVRAIERAAAVILAAVTDQTPNGRNVNATTARITHLSGAQRAEAIGWLAVMAAQLAEAHPPGHATQEGRVLALRDALVDRLYQSATPAPGR